MRIVPSSFYRQDTTAAARDLLGLLLCRRTPEGLRVGRIVETEAYLGQTDGASHAARGVTARNRRMFEAPGHAYVYFSYGMHWCFNVVTWATPPGAVLVRALEPVEGAEAMAARRLQRWAAGSRTLTADGRHLTNGPARLTQALDIDGAHDGLALFDARGPLFIARPAAPLPARPVAVTPRIGIRRAADLPLRFCYADSPCLSRAVRTAS